jgi:hypothetical protein
MYTRFIMFDFAEFLRIIFGASLKYLYVYVDLYLTLHYLYNPMEFIFLQEPG